MMKKFLKESRGITLISLSIAVIIILIITSAIIYSLTANLGIQKLRNLQTDIENLREKVSEYYAQYGDIPARKDVEYTNLNNLEIAGIISDAVDTGKFYVIELSSLDNLTLNYGQDYEQIKSGTVTDEAGINDLENPDIINETSHNIFFVEGIEVDDEWFYTDYTSEDVDKEEVPKHSVDGVVIPEGFYYVGGTKEEGIVISDSPNDAGKGTSDEVADTLEGNQFVWVPVENYEDFKRQGGYLFGKVQSLTNYGEADSNGENSKYSETDTTKKEAINMHKSVKNNKGFYIGRYETGKDDEDGVVIQKGKNVYNNVPWSSTGTITEDENIDGTENGAIEQARYFSMANNYTSVTSTLCYGVQWDAIMNYIDPDYITNASIGSPKCMDESFVKDSTNQGYYVPGSGPTKTGYYAKNNIYDLAGNVEEWTMETSSNQIRMYRGGEFTFKGSEYPASVRNSIIIPSYNGQEVGFRIALYINN